MVNRVNDNITTFSAYWKVDNNPKATARQGHLKGVYKKDVDYIICDESNVGQSNTNYISKKKDDLPSLQYLKNIVDFCNSRKFVNLKFNIRIQSSAFLDLCAIWTSKILLFDEIRKHTDSDFIVWRDCIHNKNYDDIILDTCSDKITTNIYNNNFPDKPFAGLLTHDMGRYKSKISASVIKIPVVILDDVLANYIECLQFVDNNFEIYDEEIVLTYMYSNYQQLFNFKQVI